MKFRTISLVLAMMLCFTTFYCAVESAFALAADPIKGIGRIPEIKPGQSKLILPAAPKGYTISIYGSDRLPAIDLEGNIHTPLIDVTTNLIFRLEDEKNPDRTWVSDPIPVIVPGRHKQAKGSNQEPQVVPSLREWYGREGDFQLTKSSRIAVAPAHSDVLRHVAEIVKNDVKDISGLDLDIVPGAPASGDIYLSLDETLSDLGREGYVLDADRNVTIESADAQGVLYGTRTLLQILKSDEGHSRIPRGIARDYPKYEVRGFMLDVARKFYTIDFLRDYIKLLSWYKMNTFQIHLNESTGGFRLESETYPGLAAKDGYYTKEEFRQLVRLGMEYGVNVVPEIDTPGHSRAFTEYDPTLGEGHYLNINNPKSVQFVQSLFDEYLDERNPTFIGPDVHIGTDEYNAERQEDIEAFRSYIDTMIRYVRGKGKHPSLWGGLTLYDGKTPIGAGAAMDIWHERYGEARQAAELGYDIVNVDHRSLYIVPTRTDYLNGRKLYNEWEPNRWGDTMLPSGHPRLKGGKFALWNDASVANGISMDDSHDRILPAVQVLSEKMWSGAEKARDYDRFVQLAAGIGDAPGADLSHKVSTNRKDGNVVEYLFEGGFADSSGNGYDGSAVNATLTQGRFGQGLRLNGGSSYVKTPLTSLGFGWTVSMWVKPDAGNPDDAVLMESPAGQLKLKQGKTGKLGFSKENYHSVFDYEVPAGKWTHLLLTGDNKGTVLYVNGDEYAERTDLSFPHVQTFVLPIEKIGSATNSFRGAIDNVMIFNRPIDLLQSNHELARGKKAESSALETPAFAPGKAVDGNPDTRWSAAAVDDAWFQVDLGDQYPIDRIAIQWKAAYATAYKLLVSEDNRHWTNVKSGDGIIEGKGGLETIRFDKIKARYVRFQGVKRATAYGYSFSSLEVYKAPKEMSEYKASFDQAEAALKSGQGDEETNRRLLRLVNRYPYDMSDDQ
ncbi:hypothetical protein PAE9249_02297 [Paenibacillus sp. CECT 9249]|uniref:family 20 glycosylhydrolase n=1 Tax=Paenibacillus sp. CECT 9249 TaxID=2845385 RepID=UPI001E542AD9|nr:family 20 glycosylhydrolase [Paenibacillus sp. CECT 9249]CAH0119789.1 hypothetical protein PAE9249_02297 [Paenibacillus sp. CECT 9249]